MKMLFVPRTVIIPGPTRVEDANVRLIPDTSPDLNLSTRMAGRVAGGTIGVEISMRGRVQSGRWNDRIWWAVWVSSAQMQIVSQNDLKTVR
jgi:hypothetical protein